uniref:Uncharacterized protein n=1 Tax=Candidatus Kentrum sp. DK TaxID=2126562 RepID=A0A450TJ03_9GAMM|nr:MAG: hypothetical protein BECKDK2373C_GA0170839_104328 [Candidatus Kentron sp. DK]VFJ67250.1 MAG: hypothetical protein BECKDK2373B_GA0170837_11885 [Candidatus Kentron sp. DK]
MSNEKPIFWVGASYKDLLSFPVGVKQEAGYQLHRIQNGLEPENFKPVSTIGAGVKEIRIKEEPYAKVWIVLASKAKTGEKAEFTGSK